MHLAVTGWTEVNAVEILVIVSSNRPIEATEIFIVSFMVSADSPRRDALISLTPFNLSQIDPNSRAHIQVRKRF